MLEIDLVLACLLILLGAMIAYAVDERLRITSRVGQWMGGPDEL